MVVLVFGVDHWQESPVPSTDETIHARFFALNELPLNLPALYCETLVDLERDESTGQFILK